MSKHWQGLENENCPGLMEHDSWSNKSWNFVNSHGILPILILNLTKFVLFVVVDTKKFSISPHFLTFFTK